MTDHTSGFVLDTTVLFKTESNCCEHAFEGKTARNRAFENFLDRTGSDNERRAWALLQKMRTAELSEEDRDDVRDELYELEDEGSLVAAYAQCEIDWGNSNLHEARNIIPYLEYLVFEDGFLPACGFLAESSWFLTPTEPMLYEKIEYWLGKHLDQEDCLLTAGRMAALDFDFSRKFVLKVQNALKKRADKGHRDALRLLLFKSPLPDNDDRFPHTDWARKKLLKMANADDPFALVYLGQRGYGLIPWWPEENEWEESSRTVAKRVVPEALDLFRLAAEQGDAWGKFFFAYLSGVRLSNEEFARKGLKQLEALAKEGFAPAMSYVGAHLFNMHGDITRAEELLRAACLKREQDACEKLYVDFLAWKFGSSKVGQHLPAMKELLGLAHKGFRRACLAAARLASSPKKFDHFLRMACRAGLDEAVGEAILATRCIRDTTLDTFDITLWVGEHLVQLKPHTLAALQMEFRDDDDSAYTSWSEFMEYLPTLAETHPESPALLLFGTVFLLAHDLNTYGLPSEATDKASAYVSFINRQYAYCTVCKHRVLMCAFALVVPLLGHYLQTAGSLDLAARLISRSLFDKELTPEGLERKFNQDLTKLGVDLSRFCENLALASSGTPNTRRDKKKKSSRKRR